jgi:hypothetical protein
MRPILAVILLAISANAALAVNKGRRQLDNRVPVKFQIFHADPWAVKALLEGRQHSQPEISTVAALGGGTGMQGGQSNQKSPLLQDGYLVVNPTDNSLWWYPNR